MSKKIIIIDEDTSSKNKKYKRIINNKIFEWLLYMLGYSIVLILVSILFNSTLYIDNSYYGLYPFLASVIIYILNQTIKPILVYITLPLTALTMGLFYPIINVLILYITSFILGPHLEIKGLIIPFLIAISISILNMFMEGMIIKPIIRGRNMNE